MTVTMTVTGEGLSIEREVTESTAVRIMEIVLDETTVENGTGVTVTLSGEGMDLVRDVSEKTGIQVTDVAVHDDSTVGAPGEAEKDERQDGNLPEDFFDRLSDRQRIMLEILLEADGDWMRGVDIRQAMREDYGMDVPEGGRATAGVIAGLTRKYDEEFRRDVIPGQWADETQRHAEFKIGEKYEDEIREKLTGQ